MRNFVLSVFAVLFILPSLATGRDQRYPDGPNQELTPGSVCSNPSKYRYPEQIAYCERDVATDLKRAIIARYDRQLGYRIQSMDRQAFKIDHYIPLCMGGSNNSNNLWPQHRSVFEVTDPLEQKLCEKMAQGLLRQARAIDLIKEAKNHLGRAPEILEEIEQL